MSRPFRSRPHVPSGPRLLSADEVRRLASPLVDEGFAAVAAAQGGPVSLRQLDLLGMTRDMVLERRRSRKIWSPLQGIYLPGHARWEATGQAIGALLAVGAPCWLCGASVCWRLGMLPSPPPFPHVLRLGNTRAQRDGFRLHFSGQVDPRDVTVHRGVPITTPVRAMLELAETASPYAVAKALGTGEVLKLLTRAEVAEAMQRWPGRRGLRLLREELAGDLVPRPTRSENERRFRRLWAQVGTWPPYTPNRKVLGRERDVVWADLRVVVELDGDVHFTERAAQVDRRRDSELVAAGWTVLRFSGERLRDDPYGVAAEISATLALARERAGHG